MIVLKTTHLQPGETVELSTLDGPLLAVAVHALGDDIVLASRHVRNGQWVTLKSPGNAVQVMGVAPDGQATSVLSTPQLGVGSGLLLETPRGTLAAETVDIGLPLAIPDPEVVEEGITVSDVEQIIANAERWITRVIPAVAADIAALVKHVRDGLAGR